MNSSISNEFFSNPIVWLIIFVISYIYVQVFWLNPYYLTLRIKYSLVGKKRKHSNFKILNNKRRILFYIKRDFILGGSALLITLIITIFQYYVLKDKEVSDFHSIIELSIPIVITYLIFTLFPKNNPDIGDEGSMNLYNVINKFIDDKLVIPLIESEREHYINCIYDKIKKWYKNDFNNVYFSALLIRISDKNFTDRMNIKDDDNSYKDHAISIMNHYLEGDKNIVVMSSLKELVFKYIDEDNVKLYEFIEFIAEHEENCIGRDKYKIIKQMEDINVNKDFNNETIIDVNVCDIMNRIRNIGGTEDINENTMNEN